VAEQRGILKQRAEAQIEQVQSAVLKSALRQQLNSLTFRRNQNSKFNKQKPVAKVERDIVSNRVIRDPDTAFCLALYYQPTRAQALLADLMDSEGYALTRSFATFVIESGATTIADLAYVLATDDKGYREQFADIFDRVELVPSPDDAALELNDMLARIKPAKKRIEGIRAAKLNKLPSQLTDEEKRAMRSMSSLRSN